MEEKIKIEQLVGHVKEYAEERMNLMILNVQEKAGKVISGAAAGVILSLFGVFMLMFLSFALAWWIGQSLENPFLGFLIVGGIYMLASLLLYFNREKWIQGPIINMFLKNLADEKD